MDNNIIFCLRNLDVYAGIDEDQFMKAAPHSIEEMVPAGTVFYQHAEPAEHVYVIKSGEVELLREENGKKVVLETLLPGDVFGDFGTGESSHAAVATRPVNICKTPTDQFLSVVSNHPEITLQLMRVMASRTQDYENKIAALSRPAKDQLLHELKRLKEKHERSFFGRFMSIPMRISHQRLSEKTGLNRVTVTKLMGELRRDGTIDIEETTGVISLKG